ncbi:MAG: SGNH/GDSL hydrolase family protein, partial [Planctomycetota bacterium]
VVIVYHAYNDLVANLDPRYVRDSRAESPWQLWRPLRASALYRFLRSRIQDPRESLRNKASHLTDEGTEAFARNLRRFVRRTREEGVRPVIFSYPSALRDTLEESERAGVPGLDYWFHRLSPFEYPTLIEGIRRYNAVIRRIATEESVPVIELARLLPKRVELYESTVHHSDEGEDEVARIVADALLSNGALAGPSRP